MNITFSIVTMPPEYESLKYEKEKHAYEYIVKDIIAPLDCFRKEVEKSRSK
jgi:hypothetical protein